MRIYPYICVRIIKKGCRKEVIGHDDAQTSRSGRKRKKHLNLPRQLR